jgi:hypothetical protein
MGQTMARRRLSICKESLVELLQFVGLTIFPKCWCLSTVVQEGQHISTLKVYTCLLGVHGISCTMIWTSKYNIWVVQQLSDCDKEVSMQLFISFCNWWLVMQTCQPTFLHSAVNKQNFQYWAAENPHELHACHLYDSKVIV